MARRTVAFAPEAEREARDAFFRYWEGNPSTGERFKAELIEALDRIAEEPAQAPEVDTGIRRMLFHHFPYAVLYAVGPDQILVLTAMHLRRRPGEAQARSADVAVNRM